MCPIARHNSRKLPRRRDAGFSLIEAMVSIVFLTTALLGFAGSAARIGAAVNSAHRRTTALAEARVQLEGLLARPYAELVDDTATSGGVTMQWTVTETGQAKEIQLVYRYDVPGRTREDTLAAALRKS